jgi:hypothetical protein
MNPEQAVHVVASLNETPSHGMESLVVDVSGKYLKLPSWHRDVKVWLDSHVALSMASQSSWERKKVGKDVVFKDKQKYSLMRGDILAG